MQIQTPCIDPYHIANIIRATLNALAFLILMLLSACSMLDFIVATPLPPTGTPPPSPTYDWFPASATPTNPPLVTQIATQEMRPGLGGTLLTDDFSNPEPWSLPVTEQAGAYIKSNKLAIGVKAGTYLKSLRDEPVFGDFYAEITAQPNLCREADEYGFLIRGTSSAHYRFILTCNGTVRADRASLEERHILQEAVQSGDVPPGAPGKVRIGVWAVGAEMRLFLNGRFQFAIRDSNHASGLLGVFVRAAGATPATVYFSELSIRQVQVSISAGTGTPEP